MYEQIIKFIRNVYGTDRDIPLHEPRFIGNEKRYVNDCIDSTFISSVGEYVNRFEKMICEYTGAKYAVATVNGTAALHISLILCGVERNDEVITQSLTFVATCNAISYIGAIPVFVDVDRDTLGMSPDSLEAFLSENAVIKDDGVAYNNKSGNKIKACIPMHTFGHPVRIEKIKEICGRYNILLIEDAAESIGSRYKDRHTGNFGNFGTLSFNGNKTITCGGGGMVITDNEEHAKRAKHITTTAKKPHKWEYVHDEIGFNYRLPNLNAAFACAQMENLDKFLADKRDLSSQYREFFNSMGIAFIDEPRDASSNFWLNGIILKDKDERDKFLEYTNSRGVMTRPIWRLMNKLAMFSGCQQGSLKNAEWLEERVVNIPSSVIN